MKYAWKKVSSITTSQRHLGSHRMEPTENLHPGDVYQNKVTGCTYEWAIVEDEKPHFDFSRTPDSGNSLCKELAELQEKYSETFKIGHSLKLCGDGKDIRISVFAIGSDNDWHERGELPPAGTECEIFVDGMVGKEADKYQHKKAEIMLHTKSKHGTPVAVFRVDSNDKKENEYYWDAFTARCFRPLKTERERAIEGMRKVVAGLLPKVCGALYDAGYRKEGERCQ